MNLTSRSRAMNSCVHTSTAMAQHTTQGGPDESEQAPKHHNMPPTAAPPPFGVFLNACFMSLRLQSAGAGPGRIIICCCTAVAGHYLMVLLHKWMWGKTVRNATHLMRCLSHGNRAK